MARNGRPRFWLSFGAAKLGPVEVTGTDASAAWGKFVLETGASSSEVRARAASYIRFRLQADRLGEHSPHSLDEFLDLNEPGFYDVINSEEWFVEDEGGSRLAITAPDFSSDGTIRWRWKRTRNPRDADSED